MKMEFHKEIHIRAGRRLVPLAKSLTGPDPSPYRAPVDGLLGDFLLVYRWSELSPTVSSVPPWNTSPRVRAKHLYVFRTIRTRALSGEVLLHSAFWPAISGKGGYSLLYVPENQKLETQSRFAIALPIRKYLKHRSVAAM